MFTPSVLLLLAFHLVGPLSANGSPCAPEWHDSSVDSNTGYEPGRVCSGAECSSFSNGHHDGVHVSSGPARSTGQAVSSKDKSPAASPSTGVDEWVNLTDGEISASTSTRPVKPPSTSSEQPSDETSTASQKCITRLGQGKPQHVPTSTSTTTITVTSISTITPTVTITPPPVVETEYVPSTSTSFVTPPQVTDTSTSIATVIDTSTFTAPTSTILVTSTTTRTTSTTTRTTIPTRDGFLPVISTLPGAALRKRSEPFGVPLVDLRNSSMIEKSRPFGYPQSIDCVITATATSTIIANTTALPTTVTAPASTTTETSTTVVVSESTVLLPPATTTVVITSTSTDIATATPIIVATTTITATVTQIYVFPTYAACSNRNNRIGNVNGRGIVQAEAPGSDGFAATDDFDPVSCCTTCHTTPGCAASIYTDVSSLGCLLDMSFNLCVSPGEISLRAVTSSQYAPNSGYIVSNGICGQFNQVRTIG